MANRELVKRITEERLKGVKICKPFYKSTLGLADYFKFGYEIEALIDHNILIRDMIEYKNRTLFNNTRFFGKEETTILYEENEYGGLDYSCGAEIVTPILSDSEETWRDISLACNYLGEHSRCTENCSVHINVGAQALGSDYDNWYRFLKIVAACEPEIFRFFANGEKIRKHAISGGFRQSYALPISKYIREGLEKCDAEKVHDINTLLNYCGFSGDIQYRKDKSISVKDLYRNNDELISPELLDIPAYGRRIEVRMPNGTFSADLIQYYTYVVSRLFERARNMTPAQESKLNQLLNMSLPQDYNSDLDLSRVLSTANFLFDFTEDRLQFLYTAYGIEKAENSINSKDEALKLIEQGNMILQSLPAELRSDREIVFEAVKQSGGELEFTDEKYRDDEEIVLAAVKKYGRALQFASPRLQKADNIVWPAVKNNGFALQFADASFKSDMKIAHDAVKNKAYAIQYIEGSPKESKEIALEAVKGDGLAAQFLCTDFLSDVDIAYTAVTENKYAIKYLHESAQIDKDVLLSLYDRNSYVLEVLNTGKTSNEKYFIDYCTSDDIFYKYLLNGALAGNEMFEKYILQIAAMHKKYGNEYGNRTARNMYNDFKEYIVSKINHVENRDLLLKFLEVDGSILELLSEDEKKNTDITTAAVKGDPYSLRYVNPETDGYENIVMLAVSNSGTAIRFASSDIKKDKHIVLEAVKHGGTAIVYADEALQKDKDIILAAIRSDASAVSDLDESAFDDREILLEAVKRDPTCLSDLKNEYRDDKEVILEAIHSEPFAIKYASKRLKSNKKICLEVVSANGYLLDYLDSKMKKDEEVVLTALRNTKEAIRYADPKLQAKKDELFAKLKTEEIDRTERE